MLINPLNRSQLSLFNSLDDYVSQDNYVRIINELVDVIFLEFEKDFKEEIKRVQLIGIAPTGRPAYPADVMMKMYVYASINNINSCRKLETETHRNIELIWLIGGLKPDFKTIANFRKDHKDIISAFSNKIKQFLKGASLIDSGEVALDGTKLKANASKEMLTKNDVKEKLSRLEQFISEMARNAEEDEESKIEALQQNCFDKDKEIKKLNKEIDKLKSALIHFEENPDKERISLTDFDANIMKSYGNCYPAYNVQIATETKNGFIVYEGITNEGNDINQAEPAIKQMKEELGEQPHSLLADTGYCNFDSVERLEANGTECFISTPKPQNISPEITFSYDAEKDVYICSQGRQLPKVHSGKKNKNSYVDVYIGKECSNCPIRERCTKSKKGRHISRYHNQAYRESHREKMKTTKGREKMRKRKSTVERIFGTMKTWLGKVPIKTRGNENALNEIKLFSIAYNIKRLINISQNSNFKLALATN